MKLELSDKSSFWGLCHPLDVNQMLVWLNEDASSQEVDYDSLPGWAKASIKNSILSKKITADPMPDMEEGKISADKKVETKITKKKVAKKKTRRRTKKKPVGGNE